MRKGEKEPSVNKEKKRVEKVVWNDQKKEKKISTRAGGDEFDRLEERGQRGEL